MASVSKPAPFKSGWGRSKEVVSKVRDNLFLFGYVMESFFVYAIPSAFILLLRHPLFYFPNASVFLKKKPPIWKLFNVGKICLGFSYIDSIQSFLAVLYFKNNFVVFLNVIRQAGYVNEDIFAALCRCDKAEAFCAVEKFYCSFLHCLFVLIVMVLLLNLFYVDGAIASV